MANRAVGQDAIVGQTLGHYHIGKKIGAGGMGDVYRAQDERLDREVAIKVLAPGTLADEPSRKRFHKEAIALSRLNHPNIATIHDFDTQQGGYLRLGLPKRSSALQLTVNAPPAHGLFCGNNLSEPPRTGQEWPCCRGILI